MPSTIITKNGSGAPLAADLVAGELAVDLTNGRLYTENSGGSVIEIGLNPSGNVNVTGTVTADGLDVVNLKIESDVTATPTNDGANYIFRASGTHPDYAAGDLVIQARSSAARDIYFTTGTPTPVNRMVIDSDGNVGIGTDSPDSYNAGGNTLVVGSGSGFQGMTIASGNTQSGNIYFADGTTGVETYRGHITYDHIDDHMHFKTASSEALRIDSAGNLLVGTTDTPLTLISATTGDGFGVAGADGYLSISRDATAAALYLNKTNGQGGTYIQFRADGTQVGSIGSNSGTYMYAGTGDTGILFNVDATGVQPWNTSTNVNSDGLINLGFSGSRFKDLHLAGDVNANGNLLVGTPTPTAKLVVNGQGAFGSEDASGNGIYLYVSGALSDNSYMSRNSSGTGTTTWYIGNQSITTSSDLRLKDNIVDSQRNAVEIINNLRVVDHTWNDPSDQSINNKNSRGVWTGLIAQEAVEHIPWLVNRPLEDVDENGNKNYWHMDYGYSVPLLIKAIQEQQDLIESLTARIAALEGAN
jgi:hypothetical protein